MFVLLVTQFNSFYQSVLILFAVILSTAGVLIGLLITGNPFSAILTGVGVVALAGIVVNNNIVLIDTYNKLRAENPDQDYVQLIVRTGSQRLRPVMLTTVTTVFGLLPLASNLSIDVINRTVVEGGQLSSFWVPSVPSDCVRADLCDPTDLGDDPSHAGNTTSDQGPVATVSFIL